MTTPPQPPTPAAGWYPDPSGQPGQRYWDGSQWTENRVGAPIGSSSSAVRQQTKPGGRSPKEKSRIGIGIVAAAFALVALVAINSGNKDTTPKRTVSSPTTSSYPSSYSAPSTTPKPPPGSVIPEGVRIRTEQGADGEVVIADFDIGDALFMSFTKFGARAKTKDILEYVKNKYPQASMVEVQGRFPTKDAYGNSNVSVVLDVFYSRATLDKINFEGIDNDQVWAVRDSGTIHPELE